MHLIFSLFVTLNYVSCKKMRENFKLCAILLALQMYSVSAIYNGTQALEHEFPYVVLVRSPQFFCSGSLISDRHILTAAHCLMSIKRGGRAIVNIDDYRKQNENKEMLSAKFWIHENFSMPSAVFDIGLIELPEAIKLNNCTKVMKISTKTNADLDDEDREVYFAGWGSINYQNEFPFYLQHTKMNLIPLDECKKFKSHYVEDLNENHICAEQIQGKPCR